MVVEAEETATWETPCASSNVEAPLPQPMSATRAPASSFSCTPVNAGIHALIRLADVARAKELFAAVKDAVLMLVPAHSLRRCEKLR